MSVADVTVLAPDRPELVLVAEVKAHEIEDRAPLEEDLKRYMLDRHCAVALLVTPKTTWVYRDSYRDYTQGSVELVAETATDNLLPSPSADGRELERQVFDWLERLAVSWPMALPSDAKAKAIVVEHIVPAVVDGRVVLQPRAA